VSGPSTSVSAAVSARPASGSSTAPIATRASLTATPGAPLIADSADGVHIEYHVYGHGDPAVVLIHGWACDSGYWHAQLADLQSKYTTVTLDLAGHGGSGRNRTDWSMARYGEDVAAVVRQLTNPRIILVGHSMGGPVALEAAPLIGPRLLGVIGIDTFKSLGLPPPSRAEVDQAIAPFRADFMGAMRRFVPTLFARGADASLERKVADDMSREPAQIAIASLVSLNSMDYGTLLPRIHVPIVAIDSDLGHAASEARIRKIVPSFRMVMVRGDGHFLMLEDPKRFNPILLREIDAIARGASDPQR
jgi:pimeloyl-ACP methyl ester carboxylesterase